MYIYIQNSVSNNFIFFSCHSVYCWLPKICFLKMTYKYNLLRCAMKQRFIISLLYSTLKPLNWKHSKGTVDIELFFIFLTSLFLLPQLVCIFRSVARSSISHFVRPSVRPSVRLSLTVRSFLNISYITRLGKTWATQDISLAPSQKKYQKELTE